MNRKRDSLRRLIWMIAALLIAGTSLICWTVHRTDRSMRKDLLQEARIVAQSVSLNQLQSLTGTTADLNTPVYLKLKKQLSAIKRANSRCRFAYIMGRKPDGQVFFFADNEPVGSQDEAPAGQIYGGIL